MRTTPLDRLTCIYDTVEQINVHIRDTLKATQKHNHGKQGVAGLTEEGYMIYILGINS